jgi:putative transposase
LKDSSKKHQRKSIRLSEYDYSFPNWYYITICTHERRILFGKIENGKMILNKLGNVVEEEWMRTKEIRKYVDLDNFVIMPNHLHGIIIIEQSIEKNNFQSSSQTTENVGATRRIGPTDLQGRGELNSPTGDDSGRIQYAPTKIKLKSPLKTIDDVGATRWVAQNKEDRAIQRIAPTKQTLISNSLGSIIGQYKSKVTKRLRELSGNSDLKIWQRNYYEHIIRNEIDLQNIRKYITLNPLKWEIDEYFNS